MALTAQLFGLSMTEAAEKINADFHLKLDLNAPTVPPDKPTKAQVRQREKQRENYVFDRLCAVERQANERLQRLCEGTDASQWETLWNNPDFVNTLEARARAEITLENIRLESVEL